MKRRIRIIGVQRTDDNTQDLIIAVLALARQLQRERARARGDQPPEKKDGGRP
ncbi:MAG: hypothetical protein M3Q23_00200 [Actinomycetota bacterium]|nr:hypothetical protein [Actinomycetota bacterium]